MSVQKKFIKIIDVDGLKGRCLFLPAKNINNKRHILFVYGHHSSIERWSGLIEVINRYGSVIVPDLPGFGGMESFKKINKQPTLDNFADYLADFIKQNIDQSKITIVGLSFGFIVVTRMLQRHPDLVDKVTMLISVVGFSNKKDFSFTPIRYYSYRLGTKVFSHSITASIYKFFFTRPLIIETIYHKSFNAKDKFTGLNEEQLIATTQAEIKLWQQNDILTHMFTNQEMLTLNNNLIKVNLALWHIYPQKDRYFNHTQVISNFELIFTEVHPVLSDYKGHAPSIIADADEAEAMIPQSLKNLLTKS